MFIAISDTIPKISWMMIPMKNSPHEGMNTYDNTARMHYPVLPSFDTPDPLAEQFPQHSPYAHCAANPLMYVDPTGKKIE